MSQRTQVDSACQPAPADGGHERTVKPRLLGAISATVIMSMLALAPGSAQASSLAQAPVRGVHVYDLPHFRGSNAWLNGEVGRCYYVGSRWNDKINSARTESSRLVELWDNSNCTGQAIVVDRSGYGEIGNWVSGFRIR